MSRRPAELDDPDHRHVADMTRFDRIMRAVEELKKPVGLPRTELRCSTCHNLPHECDCADESVQRFRQADGFPGDDGPEAL